MICNLIQIYLRNLLWAINDEKESSEEVYKKKCQFFVATSKDSLSISSSIVIFFSLNWDSSEWSRCWKSRVFLLMFFFPRDYNFFQNFIFRNFTFSKIYVSRFCLSRFFPSRSYFFEIFAFEILFSRFLLSRFLFSRFRQ